MDFRASKWASGASAACAVHCLAVPVLAGASCCSEQVGVLHHPMVEAGLIGFAGLLGAVTIGRAYLQHRRPLPLSLLVLGLASMIAAITVVPEALEVWFSVGGALLLIGAQWAHRRQSTSCCAAHPEASVLETTGIAQQHA